MGDLYHLCGRLGASTLKFFWCQIRCRLYKSSLDETVWINWGTLCIPLLGLCLQKIHFNHMHIRDPVDHFRNQWIIIYITSYKSLYYGEVGHYQSIMWLCRRRKETLWHIILIAPKSLTEKQSCTALAVTPRVTCHLLSDIQYSFIYF